MLESAEVLVLVKAYPSISLDLGEVDCVAGARLDGGDPRWVRLYPVPYRHLSEGSRFKKYEVINLRVRHAKGDPRPESLSPDCDSISRVRQIGTNKGWAERRRLVEPLIGDSMCGILYRQSIDGTSLGAFRPREVVDLIVEPAPAEWKTEQLATLEVMARKEDQGTLFGARAVGVTPLEKIPYRFKLKYLCDEPNCPTHEQSILDWEIGQAYRRWRQLHSEQDAVAAIKAKWLGELCGSDKDTVIFVGNQKLRPKGFLVLGIFWPPKLQVHHPQLPTLGSDVG